MFSNLSETRACSLRKASHLRKPALRFATETLHVEYEERGKEYGLLFIFRLFCEYIQLEYVRIHVIYRVNQAEYGIHILVVAPQEYLNIYSTRRTETFKRTPPWARKGWRGGGGVAFTRYRHDPYVMVYGIQTVGRLGFVYCAIVAQ